jgi:hypothetical protein
MIIRKSFSIFFNNGEIWAGNFDGLGDNFDIIRNKVLEEQEIIKRPSTPALVIFNVYGTDINYKLAEIFINSLFDVQASVKKVAFSGLTKQGKKNIKSFIKNSGYTLEFALNYFDDLEKAKQWLVSK